MINDDLLSVIQSSIWGKGTALADESVFVEMKQHSIAGLFAQCLSSAIILPELKKEWQQYILQQVSYFTRYKYEQNHLPLTVPYVILKGTSAAKYYSHPEYRTMGDIDIMTRREDYDIACKQLIENGFRIVQDIYKEITLVKKGITIDLHRQFASLNNLDYVKYLDDLIIENINSSHILPDMLNGLVLLEHINQHLESGIGLRQIIDWMMFVNKCLPDDKWNEFEILVNSIGLKKLAIITTYMCEKYLGLPHREWCAKADETLSAQLMDYILSCGNFGSKRKSDEDISENVFARASSLKSTFKLLQKQGLLNWKAINKYRFLKPFAWVYQANRYIFKGLKRDNATSKLKNEYVSGKKRNALFDALEIKTAAKGTVVYRDGKYVKK